MSASENCSATVPIPGGTGDRAGIEPADARSNRDLRTGRVRQSIGAAVRRASDLSAPRKPFEPGYVAAREDSMCGIERGTTGCARDRCRRRYVDALPTELPGGSPGRDSNPRPSPQEEVTAACAPGALDHSRRPPAPRHPVFRQRISPPRRHTAVGRNRRWHISQSQSKYPSPALPCAPRRSASSRSANQGRRRAGAGRVCAVSSMEPEYPPAPPDTVTFSPRYRGGVPRPTAVAVDVVILESMVQTGGDRQPTESGAGWTAADRAAYRRFVRSAHPDVGGDPAAFREGLARFAAARREARNDPDPRYDRPIRFVARPRGWRRAVRVLRPRRRERRLR